VPFSLKNRQLLTEHPEHPEHFLYTPYKHNFLPGPLLGNALDALDALVAIWGIRIYTPQAALVDDRNVLFVYRERQSRLLQRDAVMRGARRSAARALTTPGQA
jgi:hypothetical protein